MGKPLSRPGCFRKSSCCLEKAREGEGGRGADGGYGDGYVPQRSIYDTMCINQQIDSHHHLGGSVRRDGGGGGEGGFSYSASGSLRVSRSPADMFDPQPRSLTPNPSFVRRLDERAIYDSLKLAGHEAEGGSCHSPGRFTRSASPAVSSFSAPGVSSSSKKHHHHHHHHGDSTKSRDGRHSWKVLTPPRHLECLELSTGDMLERGGGYLNAGLYAPPGGNSSSLTSPLISPFSGSPLSSGYHTPVFFSPAKPRPVQTQSLRCSPPHVIQPRHYSQTQSLRLSPPHELRRSPYRAPLVQLSARDLQEDLRDRGWGRSEREREWEREREREMERGWAEREWERERERGRLERERARERERRETSVSSFGTFGYGRAAPLCSDRDSVFLDPDQVLDTTPLLLPQASPSPSPSAAPRMGTGAVGRNRAGSKVGPENKGMVLVDSGVGCGPGPRLGTEVMTGNMSEAKIRSGIKTENGAEAWSKFDNGMGSSIENGALTSTGSQVMAGSGKVIEEKVQSGIKIENEASAVNKEELRGGTRSRDRNGGGVIKPESLAEVRPSAKLENEDEPRDKLKIGGGSGPRTKVEIEAGLEVMANSKEVHLTEHRTEIETKGVTKVDNEAAGGAGSRAEAKVDTDVQIAPKPASTTGLEPEAASETAIKSKTETGVMSEDQYNINNMDKSQTSVGAGGKTDNTSVDKAERKTFDVDKIESTFIEKGSKSQRSRSSGSKPGSRTRPGTAIGLRPGVASPRLNGRLEGLESTGPPEGLEFTWPRRIIVRKRTVRQGGALHNLPILPPLPSVLSALEKRHPHSHLLPRPGHLSENPLMSLINPTVTSIVGRYSLKEPSHPETGHGAALVVRASLKEQNLEQWRVCREQEEHRRSRSKENQGDLKREKAENEEKRQKEEKREKERSRNEEIQDHVRERVVIDVGAVEAVKQEKEDRRGDVQENVNKKEEIKKEEKAEAKCKEVEVRRKEEIQERLGKEQQEVVAKLEGEVADVQAGDAETIGVEGEVESWDAVLEMVNTLWDDGWGKGGAGGGDTDSLPGSLQRWPLLRPPAGFGGSHPPSSAASELSLTELERRARELDSDLEHLDLSQPHRDTQDLYQTLPEPQRERADMYQTHPGPQREKATLLTGVASRSQVTLELSAFAPPATETNRSPIDWSSKPATAASTPGISSAKEDSSPDSNLTLESDSSGVFLSLSNQSQEEAGSDSDQPISGSDLGSSSTSLEKDGEEAGLKEWGREESTELQWCYPSLLNTSHHDDGDRERDKELCVKTVEDEEREKEGDEEAERDEKTKGIVSIIETQLDIRSSTTLDASQSEEIPPRKRVTLLGTDSPLPLSPSKQPITHLLDPNKPIRSSGLDCSDLDPFVQSDSFVYLAVSARPASQTETTKSTEASTQDQHQVSLQSSPNSLTTQLDKSQQEAKPTRLAPQQPEEGDFLCTDSFVYLAAPVCLLLGPDGTTPYGARESDSESSGSGPVDLSILGCGSVAGDSDWDSDLSDSDPSRSSRTAGAGSKSAAARPKRPPAEPGWDLFGETTEPEVLTGLFTEQDKNNNGNGVKVSGVTTVMSTTPGVPMVTHPVTMTRSATAVEQTSTKKVTWQFKPAQRSVCTGSRKEKEKEREREKEREVTVSSSVRYKELGGGKMHRPSPSSSSSSSSSPSSSSSG